MDIEDESDVVIHVEDQIDAEEADDLLEDECGYSLFKMLRGRNTGRKLKRKVFKFAIAELTCGFALFSIAVYEGTRFMTILYTCL
jgi:hypothetical protein